MTSSLSAVAMKLEEGNSRKFKPRIIGPAMPSAEMLAAAAGLTEAEKVTRMLSREVKNTYDPLGVKSDIELPVLKTKYRKLSFLVLPDKCQDPQAHEAFMVLNKAFKDLQDSKKKAELIDRKDADEVAREEFAAELQVKYDAAQWRHVRDKHSSYCTMAVFQHERQNRVMTSC